jgi:hypothetical protein
MSQKKASPNIRVKRPDSAMPTDEEIVVKQMVKNR